jgi:hypothetical protein
VYLRKILASVRTAADRVRVRQILRIVRHCGRRQKATRVRAFAQAFQCHESRTAVLRTEDHVFALQCPVNSGMGGIRRHLCHVRRNVFGEKQLPCVRHMAAPVCLIHRFAAPMNLQMNMNGPPLIPPRVDGSEIHDALFSAQLNAAQKTRFIDFSGSSATARSTPRTHGREP